MGACFQSLPHTAARLARLGAALACLAACSPGLPPRPQPRAETPAGFPADFYRQARAEKVEVLAVDPRRSLLVVTVRRGGSLARLGHDHVVASRSMGGLVAPARQRADLFVPLEELSVDEAPLRAQAGFDKEITPAAADGTRRNMLEKVLETARFPYAQIRVAGNPATGEAMEVDITLHGATRRYGVPVSLERNGRELVAGGRLKLRQTDFGILPFSVLGGALQVQDEVEMEFRVVAVPAGS